MQEGALITPVKELVLVDVFLSALVTICSRKDEGRLVASHHVHLVVLSALEIEARQIWLRS
jgi:hypothetical protein